MNARTKLSQRDKQIIEETVRDCTLAEPSDPFVAGRVRAHFKSGVAKPSDGTSYSVSSKSVMRQLPDGQKLSNGEGEYAVTEYFNLKRP